MKTLDKLKNKVRIDKNLSIFLIVLGLVGIIAGSVFVNILDSTDKTLINDHLNKFVDNIQNNKLDYLFVLKNNMLTNILYILIICFCLKIYHVLGRYTSYFCQNFLDLVYIILV